MGPAFFHLESHDGLKIQARSWDTGRRPLLVALHGLGEHGGHHSYLQDWLGDHFDIVIMDLRGHGKSEGERGTVAAFRQFAQDLDDLLAVMLNDRSCQEVHLFGHSMGALILCDWLQWEDRLPINVGKFFLSAPPVGFPGAGKLFQYSPTALVQKVAQIPWSFPVGPETDYHRWSHDPTVLQLKLEDPLALVSVESKLILEILSTSNRVYGQKMELGSSQIYMAIGGRDKVVCPMSAVEYFTNQTLAEEICLLPEALHEMHNEIERFKTPFRHFLRKVFIGAAEKVEGKPLRELEH